MAKTAAADVKESQMSRTYLRWRFGTTTRRIERGLIVMSFSLMLFGVSLMFGSSAVEIVRVILAISMFLHAAVFIVFVLQEHALRMLAETIEISEERHGRGERTSSQADENIS